MAGSNYETRWFLWLAMATTPLGFIAVLAGWTTTETGRQPWIVYGLLRTADAVAPVTAHAVATTLAIFFIVYNVLLLGFLWFAGRIAIRGPQIAGAPVPPRLPAGADTGPTIARQDPVAAVLAAEAHLTR